MRCPDCDIVLSELVMNDGELFLCCMNCGLIVSAHDSDYKMRFYDEEDLEATLLYNNKVTLKKVNTEDCMQNYIHKCLRCNSYGFEVSHNNFECMKCGFEWEVFDLE